MNHAFSKIWILVILVVFIAGGIFTYPPKFLKEKFERAWQYFETQKKEIEDETATWKTLESSLMGFSIKYPATENWSVFSDYIRFYSSDKDKEEIGCIETKIYGPSVGEKEGYMFATNDYIRIHLYEFFDTYFINEFGIGELGKELNSKEFVQNRKGLLLKRGDEISEIKEEIFNLNDNPAIKFTYTTYTQIQYPITALYKTKHTEILTEKNNRIYWLDVEFAPIYESYPGEDTYFIIFDQMLSTFKFTKAKSKEEIKKEVLSYGYFLSQKEFTQTLEKKVEIPEEVVDRVFEELKTGLGEVCEKESLECTFSAVDLNGDDIEEFIATPKRFCGFGRDEICVLQKINEEWKTIGCAMGIAFAVEKEKTSGYYNIMSYSHLSANSGTITRLKWQESESEYKGEEYFTIDYWKVSF